MKGIRSSGGMRILPAFLLLMLALSSFGEETQSSASPCEALACCEVSESTNAKVIAAISPLPWSNGLVLVSGHTDRHQHLCDAGSAYLFDVDTGQLAGIIRNPDGGDQAYYVEKAILGGRLVLVSDVRNELNKVRVFQPCHNGTLERGEECDDGNATDGDGCDRNCTVTRCGNGFQTTDEECDDGNIMDGDGCSARCLNENRPTSTTSSTTSTSSSTSTSTTTIAAPSSTTTTTVPSTTTTVVSIEDLLARLSVALPNAATTPGRANKKLAKRLRRYERKAIKAIENGLGSGNSRKQLNKYKKASKMLRKLLKVARRANRRGLLSSIGPIEDAVGDATDWLQAGGGPRAASNGRAQFPA